MILGEHVDKKAIALLSDGIDSPVACHLALKQGYDLVAITYDNEPFSSPENLEITKRILMRLSELHERPMKLYVIKNGENLRQIIGTLSPRTRSYVCVLCKRAMVRLANDIAEREGAAYLVTGENLGQVASQTLDNMIVISKASKRHIIRPLLCMDKLEIEKIAKEIGTYELSIEPKGGCGAIPRYPQTHADSLLVEELEKDIELMLELE